MKCEEAAEFVSVLCDGEPIPADAAKHIAACKVCRPRLEAYAVMGAKLRHLASLEELVELKKVSWDKRLGPAFAVDWWQKGRGTMRIPRYAFGFMLCVILFLSSSLLLVRARVGHGERVLVVRYKILPDGNTISCVITTDKNSFTNQCSDANSGPWGLLSVNFRFMNEDGDRTELGVKTKYENQPPGDKHEPTDDLRDVPEKRIWVAPGTKQQVSIPGLGAIELTGQYLDHMPALRSGPDEALDPRPREFRIVSPVLVRGKQVLCNFAGSSSIDSGDQDAALMIYYPGEGRYLISTVPVKGGVVGNVGLGQIRFKLDDDEYLLFTAVPATRQEYVWVKHEPEYRLSEHMQGASDDRPMFMVRKISKLLQRQIQDH